jgi:hypothetical protein
MANSNFDMSPRKSMGMGKGMPEAGDFGVESPHNAVAHPDRDMSHKPMKDSDRAGPCPIKNGLGEMASQAAPDHGPHQHRKAPGSW